MTGKYSQKQLLGHWATKKETSFELLDSEISLPFAASSPWQLRKGSVMSATDGSTRSSQSSKQIQDEVFGGIWLESDFEQHTNLPVSVT